MACASRHPNAVRRQQWPSSDPDRRVIEADFDDAGDEPQDCQLCEGLSVGCPACGGTGVSF